MLGRLAEELLELAGGPWRIRPGRAGRWPGRTAPPRHRRPGLPSPRNRSYSFAASSYRRSRNRPLAKFSASGTRRAGGDCAGAGPASRPAAANARTRESGSEDADGRRPGARGRGELKGTGPSPWTSAAATPPTGAGRAASQSPGRRILRSPRGSAREPLYPLPPFPLKSKAGDERGPPPPRRERAIGPSPAPVGFDRLAIPVPFRAFTVDGESEIQGFRRPAPEDDRLHTLADSVQTQRRRRRR